MALQIELDQQNQVIDANQRFMDEVTASRAVRQHKIQELNRRLENLEQCKICYENYDDTDHQQLAVNPCGHFMCKKCCNIMITKPIPKCWCQEKMSRLMRVYA
ncbi:Oidioi.mRNA.OKI2018_I69.chr2.g5784.t1.cds [Oikopleura dioica]|uniref:Oidioi.mRNA.OKI2018_I69.chr2.g5784.t1.cds n=1 Tax=Oikopleura dioica TaxID=34765 RepID=A0ABN7T1D7_OIKDI|nr:Oidioi.mRNA.OKI2018_I69.chr2.g5784.t1.cds [Oikopleura dioica]